MDLDKYGHLLLQSPHFPLLVFDKNQKLISSNQAGREFIQREENLNIDDLTLKMWLPFVDDVAKSMKPGTVVKWVIRNGDKTKGKLIRPYELCLFCFQSENEIVFLVIIHKSIENDVYSLLDTLDQGLCYIDAESKVQYVNQVAEELLGYNSTEIIGKSISTFVHSKDRNWFEKLCKMKKTEVRKEFSLKLLSKNGSVVETLIVGIRDNRVPGSLGLIRDVSREIKLLRYLTSFSKITSAIVWMSELGPQVHIADPVPFDSEGIPEELLIGKIATIYLTTIVQGNNPQVGLFGPFPIAESTEYSALCYSFNAEITPWHPKMKPETTVMFLLFYPQESEFLFFDRKPMEIYLNEYFDKINKLDEITIEILQKAKEDVLLAKYKSLC